MTPATLKVVVATLIIIGLVLGLAAGDWTQDIALSVIW